MIQLIALAIGFAVLLGAAYVFGAYSHKRQWWPLSLRHPATPQYVFDRHGRLAGYPGKVEVPCPAHPDYVLLILGQSNAANCGGQRYTAPGAVNYFNGRCYRASSPLLGASGISGEPWTLLANKLGGCVALVPAAVGSTTVKRWAGDLGVMVEEVTRALPWPVTHVLWHQGEDDYAAGTTDYAEQFAALLARLRKHTAAPVYVSVASRAGLLWVADNPVARAQRSLPNGTDVFQGPDTDTLLGSDDRFEDTHFGGSGLEKFATAWAQILRR